MASVKLSTKAVGSIVKLKVNGTAREFIVVHQGKPSSLYDDSCNGTWLLMKDIYESRQWHSSNVNDYANSTIHSYLNSTFLALFESNIQTAIKQVKIPYRPGSGTSMTVNSGANGLSAKIFLLADIEMGGDTSWGYMPTDGAKLDYFTKGNDTAANNIRIAYLNGTAALWWSRSPYTGSAASAWDCGSNGDCHGSSYCSSSCGVRPALVLPSDLSVSDDGSVQTNTAPTVSASSTSLGTKTAAFSFQYTPADADGDSLTVKEYLDGVLMKTRTSIASGTTLTFECASTASLFQQITNGSHTITIEVSDGQETASLTATFTKAVYTATITLKTPMAVAGDIDVAILALIGDIPAGANLTVEVTNNANDASPVWQDVTTEVKNGTNIVFTNNTATNGAAFNFRITVERGTSAGGYISAVTGAFQ